MGITTLDLHTKFRVVAALIAPAVWEGRDKTAPSSFKQKTAHVYLQHKTHINSIKIVNTRKPRLIYTHKATMLICIHRGYTIKSNTSSIRHVRLTATSAASKKETRKTKKRFQQSTQINRQKSGLKIANKPTITLGQGEHSKTQSR